MAHPKVIPFRGFFYNPEKIPDLSRVVTPPYDVISPEMQEKFIQSSPFNFINVDFRKEPGDEKYPLAAKTYRQWIQDGVLIQDTDRAFYFHRQTFSLPDGRLVTRKGFFGARLIEDFSEGGIKPHEKTLEGPKTDRLNLTRAVDANLSPVFALYSDPEKLIDDAVKALEKTQPLYDFNFDGQRHQLWKVSDLHVCEKVMLTLQERPVFIADGHHRYETALNYRNERRKADPHFTGLEPYNYTLMYFSNMNDEGLIILPIHRAVHNIKGFSVEQFISILSEEFYVTKLDMMLSNEAVIQALAIAGESSHAYALITKDPKVTYLFAIDREKWRDSPMAQALPPSLASLDVTVLHRVLFEKVLGMTPEAQARQENLIYWKDTQKAMDETRKGNCEMTFLLNPTRIEEVEKVAMAGEKMPQKSTYFYPKVLSGLVVHGLG